MTGPLDHQVEPVHPAIVNYDNWLIIVYVYCTLYIGCSVHVTDIASYKLNWPRVLFSLNIYE